MSKKILSKTTANKYITALQKINYSRLNANKQNIYDYLYFKLKSYGEAVKTINSVNSTNLAPSTNYTDSGITFSSNYEKDYIQELIKYTKDNISVDSQYIFNRN
ncbi:TPA: hypothetical protein DEG21_05345 [Patescibacteria group bacterium]|nr:hypothetical protein [Candidatus Gracilibacteria bacterium]HBY75254.1 hypothetical protein [Candidatus Gracilibacteria bacterium]